MTFIKTFDEFNSDIQHAGTTVISSLFTKPVLYFDIIFDNKTLLGDISSKLETIGYLKKEIKESMDNLHLDRHLRRCRKLMTIECGRNITFMFV